MSRARPVFTAPRVLRHIGLKCRGLWLFWARLHIMTNTSRTQLPSHQMVRIGFRALARSHVLHCVCYIVFVTIRMCVVQLCLSRCVTGSHVVSCTVFVKMSVLQCRLNGACYIVSMLVLVTHSLVQRVVTLCALQCNVCHIVCVCVC